MNDSALNADRSHIGSHDELLWDLSSEKVETLGTIDTIIVPTVHPQRVGPAIDLATRLGCAIVLLCSTPWQAQEIRARRRLPTNAFVHVVPPDYEHPLLDFGEQDEAKHSDIARKRNIGLLLARLCGRRRILFLDDDIRGMEPSLIRKAAALADRYPIVGFRVREFPDNSVVCHAYRAAGGEQSTFVSGSCLLVDTYRVETFFPWAYNEDWFFFHDAVAARLVAVAGELTQLEYDPFRRNAASEEFGDLIAEALVRAIHRGSTVGTPAFWRDAIARRGRFIDEVAAGVRDRMKDGLLPDGARILDRLAEAKARLQEIRPTDCLAFYTTWRQNIDIWRQRLQTLPTSLTAHQAAEYLGLSPA